MSGFPRVAPGEVRALVRTLDGCPDPTALHARLTDGGERPDTLLLESGDTTTRRGDNSLLAVRSALRLTCSGRTVAVRALTENGRDLLPWLADGLQDGGAAVTRAGGEIRAAYPPPADGDEETRLRAPSPMDALRAVVTGPRLRDTDPRHGPIVAGVFAYDLLGVFESLPAPSEDPIGWPDYEMWLPDRLIWIDHRLRRATVVAHVYGGADDDRAYHDAADDVGAIAAAIQAAPPADEAETAETTPDRTTPGQAAQASVAVTTDQSDEDYAALVTTLKDHIVRGDVFQIVPSRTFSLPCARPLATYRRLRELNPSPYMFYVNGTRGVLFGASPETAVRVSPDPEAPGHSRVDIRPIAGTRRRARLPGGAYDHDLDSRLEAELRLDEKELAEHMMLVDLARNDVARVSEPGTRWVDRLLTVERYSHVMHLVSNVRGHLRGGLDALHAYVATMNMGTLTGAPKLEAAKLLRRHEPTRRGPYGGAVGYFAADGRLDTSIVIRSAVHRDGVAHVRAGAGVVHDSVPELEADETRRKAEAVLQAIREAEDR